MNQSSWNHPFSSSWCWKCLISSLLHHGSFNRLMSNPQCSMRITFILRSHASQSKMWVNGLHTTHAVPIKSKRSSWWTNCLSSFWTPFNKRYSFINPISTGPSNSHLGIRFQLYYLQSKIVICRICNKLRTML